MKHLDKNKNGEVENGEFLEMVDKKKYSHSAGKDLEMRKFDLADKNNDGALQGHELDMWLVSKGLV